MIRGNASQNTLVLRELYTAWRRVEHYKRATVVWTVIGGLRSATGS